LNSHTKKEDNINKKEIEQYCAEHKINPTSGQAISDCWHCHNALQPMGRSNPLCLLGRSMGGENPAAHQGIAQVHHMHRLWNTFESE